MVFEMVADSMILLLDFLALSLVGAYSLLVDCLISTSESIFLFVRDSVFESNSKNLVITVLASPLGDLTTST